MSKVILKPIAETEKCFLDESINDKKEYKSGSALLGERYNFQLAYQAEDKPERASRIESRLYVESPISEFIKIQRIESVPVRLPVLQCDFDDTYLRGTPGLYPDLLKPYDSTKMCAVTEYLQAYWVDIFVPEDATPGVYPIKFKIVNYWDDNELLAETEFNIEIIGAVLPKQETIVTQWFHADCLAVHYGVEIFSEEHWSIIAQFIDTAVKNGINMILTPIFTLALDTHPGTERPTVQLIDVSRINNEWKFGFDKLERWVNMCLDLGVEYFEISHLFTQWGARHTPKVMATTENGYERVFGWDTDAHAPEYTDFLKTLIPQLLEKLKELGVDKKVAFHISDEPGEEHLESYLSAKNTIKECLEGQVIMDALSDISFYEKGVVEHPVVSTDHIKTYIERGIKHLWAYYCCCQTIKVSNRLLAMPTSRNRIIGQQMYKYDIEGFLQWGYNFYFTQGSAEYCNPYECTDGSFWVPAGDTFSVYPAPGGAAYESIHLEGFTAALTDMRAFRLAEKLTSKEKVMSIIEEQGTITFEEYPRNDEQVLSVREKVNKLIKDNI